jgi:hypothetical protein
MASLFDTFSALVVEMKELTGLAEGQFLSFPAEQLPFDKTNLVLEDPNVAYEFAALVNSIPDDSPQFVRKADFIWRVYKTILEEKDLAPEPLSGITHSTAFHNARETFGLDRPRPNGEFFYDTSVLPIDLDDPQIWTRLIIDNAATKIEAAKLDEVNKAWLGQFRLLNNLGESFVEAVTCEVATISIVRPWLDPDVFEWRFWDMPDTIFSDGKVPATGKLPCIISKMVVARNIKVIISTSPLPQISNTALFRKQGNDDGHSDTDIITQLISFSNLSPEIPPQAELIDGVQKPEAPDAQATVAASLIQKFGHLKFADIKHQLAQPDRSVAEPPSDTPKATDAPIRGLHVPFSFDTETARIFWTSELASSEAALTSHTAQQTATQANIPRIRSMITAWQEGRITDHRTPPQSQQEAIAGLESGLVQEQQSLQKYGAIIANVQATISFIKNTLNILTKLSEKPVNPQSFVLAMVCTRTPKSPNPDPELFGQIAPTP